MKSTSCRAKRGGMIWITRRRFNCWRNGGGWGSRRAVDSGWWLVSKARAMGSEVVPALPPKEGGRTGHPAMGRYVVPALPPKEGGRTGHPAVDSFKGFVPALPPKEGGRAGHPARAMGSKVVPALPPKEGGRTGHPAQDDAGGVGVAWARGTRLGSRG